MEIQIDAADFLKQADALGAAADQMPFILSLSLNRAVKDTRAYLTEHTWPDSITQRNSSFIKAALQTEFSKKNNLEVTISDKLGRASLLMHAEGGTKVPKGKNLAVPSSNIRITQRGASKSQRPRALINAFVNKKNQLVQRTGKGKNARLRVMYFLKPSVRIPADVPFYADFATQMQANIVKQLPDAVVYAMRTRR